MIQVAVLDDYHRKALSSADWGSLQEARITVFDRPFVQGDDIARILSPFDVIVAMRERTPFPAGLIAQMGNLRLLVTTGMKNRSIDLAAATEHGIVVCGTDSLGHPPAELTWALILSLARQIPEENAAMHGGEWAGVCGIALAGRTLGLLGLGRQGARVARVGLAFGMNVIAWSPRLTEERAAEQGVRRVDMDTLFATSDILSIHVVLNQQTRGLVDERMLKRMKPDAYLINTSRGPIIDEAALIEALLNKHIAGAGLDVYDEEPLPADHPLRGLDNAILAGHKGYVVQEMYPLAYGQAVEDIRAWMDGVPIRVLNGN